MNYPVNRQFAVPSTVRARDDRLGLDGRLLSNSADQWPLTLSLCALVWPRCTLQRLQSPRSRSQSTLNAAFVNSCGTSILRVMPWFSSFQFVELNRSSMPLFKVI